MKLPSRHYTVVKGARNWFIYIVTDFKVWHLWATLLVNDLKALRVLRSSLSEHGLEIVFTMLKDIVEAKCLKVMVRKHGFKD